MTTIRPIGDRVVLRAQEAEEMSDGGIIIPGTVSEKPDIGQVVAIGPGLYGENDVRQPLMVSEGDVITFAKSGGSTISVDGEELIVIHEHDIIAIIE